MFDTVVIDVFIGLVLIYLLYSLLATILMEIILTTFGIHARNLKLAVDRILCDHGNKNIKEQLAEEFDSLKVWLLEFFTYWGLFSKKKIITPGNPDTSDAPVNPVNDFYGHNAIKSLSSGKLFSKPSYIKANTFSSTLIDLLIDKGVDVNMPEGKDPDIIYKGIERLFKNQPETKQQLKSMLNFSDGDIDKFKAHLDDLFEETVERSIGWFKRKTQIILLIIGFVIACSFNVNTIYIVNKLAKDDKAREQLVKMAENTGKWEQYIQDVEAIKSEIDSAGANTDSIQTEIHEMNKNLSELYAIKDTLLGDIESANTIVAAGGSTDWDGTSFPGFLLTAFAISLGAPFWFDILNKVTKLRNSLPQNVKKEELKNEVPLTQRKG